MLTEKDYCDYDTCVALKESGYKVPTSAYYISNDTTLYFVSNPFRGGYAIDCFYSHNSLREGVVTRNYIDAPTMWEAQKWLRKEKQMLVSPLIFADNLIDEDGKIVDRWKYYSFAIYSTSTAEFIRNYDQGEEYESYEEALLEGIKEAIKLFKECENTED